MSNNAPTTRLLNWRELVMKAWGQEYNVPETAYEFHVGKESVRRFQSTDNQQTGVYKRG